jgi:hypothetical protein
VNLNGKQVSLRQLEAELAAAGVTVRGLGIVDGALHTYDEDGAVIDVPPAAAAIIAAHVPPPEPQRPDFGADVPTDGAYLAQASAAVGLLRDYLALQAPTGPQTVAALKVAIRALLWLLRRQLTSGG